MTVADFIRAIKRQTSDAAVFGTTANLERPPGRKPREQDVMLSGWYNKLPSSDQAYVIAAMREAAELAVFSFLCMLDGVSAVEDGNEKGDLRLSYIKDGVESILNSPTNDFLHDMYNLICQTSDPIAPSRPEARL